MFCRQLYLVLFFIFLFPLLVFSAHIVEKRLQVSYENTDGISVSRTFSGNYGVTSFSIIDAQHTAFLCNVDRQIKVYHNDFQDCILTIALNNFPEDFICFQNRYYVLSNYCIDVFDNNGEFLFQFPLHSDFKFIERLYGFQNDLFLLYANGHSYKILENGEPLPPEIQKHSILYGFKMGTHTAMRVTKDNNSEFTLYIFRDGVQTREIPFWVDNKLGSVSIIGLVDDVIYFDVQYILQDVPLKIERHIVAYTLHGDQIIDNVTLPNCYYLYMKRDILASGEGIHHLIASPDCLHLFLLNFDQRLVKTSYPRDVQDPYHYNWYLPKTEPSIDLPTQNKNVNRYLSITRSQILKNAEAYEKLQWTCYETNTTYHELVRLPDGAYVRTPTWVVPGHKSKMPYKWGGFTHVNNFLNRIEADCLAGDDYCVRGVDYAASYGDMYCIGVDCSGFVSRSWGLQNKEWTGSLPNISTELSEWSDAVRGDIANAAEQHVMLIVSDHPSGSMGITHANGADWRVSSMIAYPNHLTGYVPRKYDYVVNDLEESGPATIPTIYALYQNYPNPFNATTAISYDVPQFSYVKLDVYNIRGQPIKNLFQGFQHAQKQTVNWDATSVPSGVYIYRIQIGSWRSVKKCVLAK